MTGGGHSSNHNRLVPRNQAPQPVGGGIIFDDSPEAGTIEEVAVLRRLQGLGFHLVCVLGAEHVHLPDPWRGGLLEEVLVARVGKWAFHVLNFLWHVLVQRTPL
mmetsp:Transcript_4604/g.7014  ORF Transcript_4604/g.7014 Transcript_4604/m.7014 type:complete len:104 (+) Transcript_4604:697-1008(+)